MGLSQRLEWETIRSIDSATFTGLYQALGGPFIHPAYKVKLVNNSSVLVTISNDGINDKDVAPANSFWLYDETVAVKNEPFCFLPAGTQISVKGSAGTGSVYLVVQYIIEI